MQMYTHTHHSDHNALTFHHTSSILGYNTSLAVSPACNPFMVGKHTFHAETIYLDFKTYVLMKFQETRLFIQLYLQGLYCRHT